MRLGVKVKEKLARTIAEHFTTNEIVNVFTDAGIRTDKSLYAKWRIILDAFGNTATDEAFAHILEGFCHPLSFDDPQIQEKFINELNEILSYEKLQIQSTDTSATLTSTNGKPVASASSVLSENKTSMDNIIEAINFFKNEYNKVRMAGLTYEYPLGNNFKLSNYEPEFNEINHAHLRKIAIEQLKEVGFVREYEIEERVVDDYGNVFDFAICKIDESKITEKEAPKATDAGVETLTQKVIHEHTHRFENSIQEKEIDVSHKFTEEELLVKNKKKIALPKFPPTDWGKVEIRFLSENDIYIKAGEKSTTADYEGLGFRNDKNGKPNTAWHFFFELAKKSGETPVIASPIPDAIKNQKRMLSDRLKTIFKNDTDPFFDFSQTNTYKIKFKLLPPTTEQKSDSLGVDEYLQETMTSKYESEG